MKKSAGGLGAPQQVQTRALIGDQGKKPPEVKHI